MTSHTNCNDYTIGWICTLPVELAAAQEMLDFKQEYRDKDDPNIYTLGRVGGHNVVLVCLPPNQIGPNYTTAVTIQMMITFPIIGFVLLVGTGGGIPSKSADIRLGDIVVSEPVNGHSAIIQYDFGKCTPSGFEQTGSLYNPPPILLNAVKELRYKQSQGGGSLTPHLSKLSRYSIFRRDQAGQDVLFEANYQHDQARGDSCVSCNAMKLVERKERANNAPLVHYGSVLSGCWIMQSGAERDRISSQFGRALCFEMQAVGVMNILPCLAICGICDYADSHRSKSWQPYAAATSAAYAKELLLGIGPTRRSTSGNLKVDDRQSTTTVVY
ncbi:hypothetical protein VI817_009587 [Penicillium citrinum]|nr:hypothetical protein VI817_009587 [Penicillium citrinum]